MTYGDGRADEKSKDESWERNEGRHLEEGEHLPMI